MIIVVIALVFIVVQRQCHYVEISLLPCVLLYE